MNHYNIVINGANNSGAAMANSIRFTPAETVNNRRESPRNPNIKALNWEELLLHLEK